jgi:hypothetical protein
MLPVCTLPQPERPRERQVYSGFFLSRSLYEEIDVVHARGFGSRDSLCGCSREGYAFPGMVMMGEESCMPFVGSGALLDIYYGSISLGARYRF